MSEKLHHAIFGSVCLVDNLGKVYTALVPPQQQGRVLLYEEGGRPVHTPGWHTMHFDGDSWEFRVRVTEGGDCDFVTLGNSPQGLVFDSEGQPYLVDNMLHAFVCKFLGQPKLYVWEVARLEKRESVSVLNFMAEVTFADDIMEPDKFAVYETNEGGIISRSVKYDWGNE